MLTADWGHVSGCQENLARSTISCSLYTALVLDVIFDLETSSSVVRNLSVTVLPSRLFPVHPLLFETLNTISVCQLTPVLKLSRNASERHTVTFWKGGAPYRNFWRCSRRNARLAFRLFCWLTLQASHIYVAY